MSKPLLQQGHTDTLQAREVLIIITGAHKSLALQKCIEGGVNHMWTLSSLQMHPYAMIVVDEDATLELQVKTVKYFKSIEQVATSEGFGQALASEEMTMRKRDSVLEQLDSPKSPTAKSFLAGPKPTLTRVITADPQSESVTLAPPKPEIVRSVTPDLVNEAMHSRIPETLQGLDGLEVKELPIEPMHDRVDSATA